MVRFELPKDEILATTLVLEQEVECDPPRIRVDVDIVGECIVEYEGAILSADVSLVRRIETHVGTCSESLFDHRSLDLEGENGREVYPFVFEVKTFPYTYLGHELKVSWFIITTFHREEGEYVSEKKFRVLVVPAEIEF